MIEHIMTICRFFLIWMGLSLLLFAAVNDFRRFIIPNWISLSVLGLGILYGVLTSGFPWLWNIFAATLVFAISFCLFMMGALGGGDAKLLTAVSFWGGIELLGSFALVTAVFGGILSLMYLLVAWWKKRKQGAVEGSIFFCRIPYGVAIAIGGIYVFLSISGQIV